MNFKIIVLIVLVGGVLIFIGMKPSSLLDQGGNVWGVFSRDFMAIFNGEANDRLAKEIRGNAEKDVQTIYDAAPTAAGDEESKIVHDINRDRKDAAKTVKVIDINTEELKQRIEDQKRQLE